MPNGPVAHASPPIMITRLARIFLFASILGGAPAMAAQKSGAGSLSMPSAGAPVVSNSTLNSTVLTVTPSPLPGLSSNHAPSLAGATYQLGADGTVVIPEGQLRALTTD